MSILYTLLPLIVCCQMLLLTEAKGSFECHLLFSRAAGFKTYPRALNASKPTPDYREFLIPPEHLKMQYEDLDAKISYEDLREFQYVFSVGSYKFLEGSERRHLYDVFQRKRGGILIPLKHITGIGEASIDEKLVRIEKLLINQITNQDLDAYFEQIKLYKTSGKGSDFWQKKISNENTERHLVAFESNLFNEGIYATKVTIDKGKYFLETVDTVKEKLTEEKVSLSQLRDGQNHQQTWIHEIMEIIGHEYSVRRHWSEDFINSLRKKAINTANHTKYIIIREKTADGSKGKILGTLGVNRAPYGSATFFENESRTWQISYGPMGPLYMRENLVQRENYLSSDGWDQPLPILNIEEYLNILLPRPITIFHKRSPGDRGAIAYQFSSATLANSFDTIFSGMGIIFEPVRLFVDKEAPSRGVAYEELLKEFYKEIFQTDLLNGKALTDGQYFYTYNTKEGIALYKKQGFKVLNDGKPITKDGHEWYLLGASPRDLLERGGGIHRKNYSSDTFRFIELLERSINGEQ